jgi:FlaG/FlaF family flagellin (archaellin)
MRNCPGYDHCAGVSEVIGSVLLISLVVGGAALVGIFLLSQQTPTKIPNVNFMVGVNDSGKGLYLFHNGGDSLRNGEFSVLVDGVSKSYTIVGGTDNWSLGKNLQVNILSPPQQVQVVYNTAGSGATVLSSASVNVSTTPGFTPADISATAPLPNYCTLCDLNTIPDQVAQGYMTNLTSNYIYFGRDTQVTLATTNSFFNFTVTKPGSSIQLEGITPYPYTLNVGDKVNLTPRGTTTSLKIFAIGGEIWELRALSVNYEIRNAAGALRTPIGGSNTFDIFNAWITGCKIDSTLDITSTATASPLLLVMNGTIKFNTNIANNATNIVNMRPTKNGLFSFIKDAGAPGNVYFVGNADSVTVNGVPQT